VAYSRVTFTFIFTLVTFVTAVTVVPMVTLTASQCVLGYQGHDVSLKVFRAVFDQIVYSFGFCKVVLLNIRRFQRNLLPPSSG